jgi:hypothetical protein
MPFSLRSGSAQSRPQPPPYAPSSTRQVVQATWSTSVDHVRPQPGTTALIWQTRPSRRDHPELKQAPPEANRWPPEPRPPCRRRLALCTFGARHVCVMRARRVPTGAPLTSSGRGEVPSSLGPGTVLDGIAPRRRATARATAQAVRFRPGGASRLSVAPRISPPPAHPQTPTHAGSRRRSARASRTRQLPCGAAPCRPTAHPSVRVSKADTASGDWSNPQTSCRRAAASSGVNRRSGGSQFEEFARGAKPRQGQRGIAPGGDDHMQPRRKARQQKCQALVHLRRLNSVVVIQYQRNLIACRFELIDQGGCHPLARRDIRRGEERKQWVSQALASMVKGRNYIAPKAHWVVVLRSSDNHATGHFAVVAQSTSRVVLAKPAGADTRVSS